jgi:hypothetical protein
MTSRITWKHETDTLPVALGTCIEGDQAYELWGNKASRTAEAFAQEWPADQRQGTGDGYLEVGPPVAGCVLFSSALLVLFLLVMAIGLIQLTR